MNKTPAFTGFRKEAFTFFKQIGFYQSREWYLENKPTYEKEALQPMITLVAELTKEMQKMKLPLAGDPKRSLFRIHRDVRFSKDKTPYKTHIAATLSRDGRKLSPGMLYVHISPEECFAAIGTWHPAPDELARLRAAVAGHPKRWLTILKELEAEGLELSQEEMLKRMPRGLESFADSPLAGSLKQRNFILHQPLPASSVSSKKLVSEITAFIKKGRKFLEFQWSAVDEGRK